MSYNKEKLGTYIDILSGFAFKTKDFVDVGIPVIKIKNINPPFVSLDNLTYVSKEIAEKQNKFVLSYDDVLIAMTGSHINQWDSVVGRVARVKYYEKTLLNQRVGKIIIKENSEADINYIYYFLSQDKVKIELASKAGGAANQANISPSHIKELQFPCPKYKTQIKIAQILCAYDDLIENNQKQIKLLEESAQRLYKEWFVDLRFPGYEKVKVVDGVPEGWTKDILSNVAILKAGGDKPKVFSKKCDSKYVVPVYSNGTEHEGLYGYTDVAAIKEACVTISARGSVGYICLRRIPFVPIVRLISVIPKELDVIYLYLYLNNFKFDSNGAAQQQITVPMIKEKQVLIPAKDILDKFIQLIYPIQNAIDKRKNQIEKLIEARDRLLPKLMSGELEV